jgi:hypothetical protein
MSNKVRVAVFLAAAVLAAGVWGQEKPSPFSDLSHRQEAEAAPAAVSNTPVPYNSAPVPYNGAPVPYSSSAPAMPAPDSNSSGGNAAPVFNNAGGNSPAASDAVPASSARASAASRDPFPEDVIAINQADSIWRATQDRLEELGSGCVASGSQLIDQARDAKLKSVASYAKYYQDTIGYWTRSRDSSGEAELSSRTDAAELQAHLNQLQLELQSVNRRKADLDRTFGENHVDNSEEKAALADLTRIQISKQEQIEKARAAVEQNKAGHEWVMKRKEYARVRLAETNELLQGTRTELYLYQQLYSAILYRHNLSCDREISRPIETLSDWRQDVKKLSTANLE